MCKQGYVPLVPRVFVSLTKQYSRFGLKHLQRTLARVRVLCGAEGEGKYVVAAIEGEFAATYSSSGGKQVEKTPALVFRGPHTERTSINLLTPDHNLRSEAMEGAQQVCRIEMMRRDMIHRILKLF